MKKFEVQPNDSGQRIDKFLKKLLPKAPNNFLYKAFRKKDIKVNGIKVEASYILKPQDIVSIFLHEDMYVEFSGGEREITITKTNQDFQIVYEDDHFMVVDKPTGLLSQPNSATEKNSLVDQIIYYLWKSGKYDPKMEQSFTPAICNRLDQYTSGLVLAGKDFHSLQKLNEAVGSRLIKKYYLTIVKGKVSKTQEISGYLIKDENTNKVSIYQEEVEGSKKIETHYKPLYTDGNFTLLQVNLITGRTHQIRAHLSYIGITEQLESKISAELVKSIVEKSSHYSVIVKQFEDERQLNEAIVKQDIEIYFSYLPENSYKNLVQDKGKIMGYPLAPLGYDNSYVFLLQEEEANKLQIKGITQLLHKSYLCSVGVDYRLKYSPLEIEDYLQPNGMDENPFYTTFHHPSTIVDDVEIEVIATYSTNSLIKDKQWVSLTPTDIYHKKHIAIPMVLHYSVHSKITKIWNPYQFALTNENMIKLKFEIEKKQRSVSDVITEFLNSYAEQQK